MCRRAEEEKCELAKKFADLNVRVGKLESSQSVGFENVHAAISNLANEFGMRMNTIQQQIVEEQMKHNERADAEKAKWGDELRRYLRWAVITILSGSAVAMGVTIWSNFTAK